MQNYIYDKEIYDIFEGMTAISSVISAIESSNSKRTIHSVLYNVDKKKSKYNELLRYKKALEILKNKPHISFDLFDTLDTLEEINNYIEFMYGRNDTSILTQEEYDLFKEMLK